MRVPSGSLASTHGRASSSRLPRHRGKPLSQPPDGGRILEDDPGQLESTTAVHPHPVRSRHQHIGHRRVGQQPLQHPGADKLAPQFLGRAEDFRVTEQ